MHMYCTRAWNFCFVLIPVYSYLLAQFEPCEISEITLQHVRHEATFLPCLHSSTLYCTVQCMHN